MEVLIKCRLILELILLSTGIVSTFFMLKNASPLYFIDMVLGSMSEILNSLKSFLSSSLYICLFINSVVLLILTFSKFHHLKWNFLSVLIVQISSPAKPKHHEEEENVPRRSNSAIAMDTVMSFFSRYSHPVSLEEDTEVDCVQKTSLFHFTDASDNQPCSPNSRYDITNHQRTAKPKNQETKVSNQENVEAEETEDDSLEATWRVITGGVNKDKILKKSETFTWAVATEELLVSAESIESKDLLPSAAAAWKDLRKSVTFNDSLSTFRRGGLRGDFSVTTAEESNKRFDDFIKKINCERVLQRQESHQRALKRNTLNRAR